MKGRRMLLISSLAMITVLVAACGTQSTSGGKVSKGGVLTIDNESGTLWNCQNLNPLSANANFLVFGPVYEPLVYINLLNGKTTPMLASSYTWKIGRASCRERVEISEVEVIGNKNKCKK